MTRIDDIYLEKNIKPLFDLYNDLENDLIASIARRISETNYLTESAKFELEKLEQMKLLDAEAVRKISAAAKKSKHMIEKLIRDAGLFVLEHDEEIYREAYSIGVLTQEPVPLKMSPEIRNTIKGAIKNAQARVNLTNSEARASVRKAYYSASNKAYMETYTGVKSITSAIHDAVVEMADKGVTVVSYSGTNESGKKWTRHDHIDVATRRNIVTSVNQANGELAMIRAKEWRCNLVEVSKHVGERPSHAVWSGEIYAIEGTSYGEYGFYANLREATGYGTAGGLKGVNCRHTFGIFIEGLSTKTEYPTQWYDAEWQKQKYDESQKQRSLERDVRAIKRQIAGAVGEGEDIGKLSLKLKKKQSELKSYVNSVKRTRRTNREQVVEFNRSISAKSTWAARKELLPNYKEAIIPDEKIAGYALNKNHSIGGDKAIAFEKYLGYNIDNKDLFVEEIRYGLSHSPAIKRGETEYGTKYNVPMDMRGVNGKTAKVSSGWQIDNDSDKPRIITIYIDE